MIYDTLQMAQRLEKSFTREQATALTEAVAASTAGTIATKSDIVELRAELRGDIAILRTDLVKWIVGAIVLNLFGTAGLGLTLVRYTAR